MIKRHLSLLALVLTAALALTSCAGPGGTDSGSGVTLTLMGKKTDLQKSYMVSIFEQYEQATGNHLKLISLPDETYEQAAADAFAKGNVPDIFLHFHNADLARFDLEKDFLPLNDQDWVDDLTDSAQAYCTDSEGTLLGLPFWESSVSGCYYNKTLLDDLGLSPATTQTEFDVLCQALADTGYTPICWPADGCTWMPQFGLDPLFADDPDLLEALNDHDIAYADIPGVRDMVQWLADAAHRGWFGPDFLQTGWDDISPALASGRAVMTFIWDTWFYTDFEKDNTYSVDDFALMPVFMNTADGGTYEGGNLNMMMVTQGGDHVTEALEFLSFCAAPEHCNAAFDGISTVSCFREQTANIQSRMVTDAEDSIAAHERVSTAASKIVGYNAEDVCAVLNSLFRGERDVDGSVAALDQHRLSKAGRDADTP